MILELQKKIPLAEAGLIFPGRFSGLVRQPLDNISLHLTRQAGGQGDNPLVIAVQHLHIHPGLVVIALGKALADNLYQVVIARIILGQKNQMIIPVLPAVQFLVKPGVWSHIDLAAQNGLDSRLLRRQVKVDGAVHDAVIRDGGTVHAQLLHPRHIFLYFIGSVQKRILRMNMKMCKCHDPAPFFQLLDTMYNPIITGFPHYSTRKNGVWPHMRHTPLRKSYMYFFRLSALSTASQGRDTSSRPKCP